MKEGVKKTIATKKKVKKVLLKTRLRDFFDNSENTRRKKRE